MLHQAVVLSGVGERVTIELMADHEPDHAMVDHHEPDRPAVLGLIDLSSQVDFQVVALGLVFVYAAFIRRDRFGSSALDRQQKKAQLTELNASNTKPHVFVLLAAFQLLLVVVVSLCVDALKNFMVVGISAIMSHVFGYLLSEWSGTGMFFDLTGEVTLVVVFLYAYLNIGRPSLRQHLAFFLAGMWAVRLGVFLFWRIVARNGNDWRFNNLILANGRTFSLFCWVCQGTWIWLLGFCLWLLAGVGSEGVHPSADAQLGCVRVQFGCACVCSRVLLLLACW